ncbi:MAG: zinc-ribbon domain-containing protein [Deltaproteobacteria bacterium]
MLRVGQTGPRLAEPTGRLMIVQCDKCQTKFRIADEKVRPNGVKVRCSRCAHVFVVRKEPATAPNPAISAMSGEGRDPFESRTVPTIPDASSMVSGLPTARAPVPAASTASSLEAAAALGFSGLPAPPKKAPLPPLDQIRGLGGPSGLGETFRSFTGSEALTVRSENERDDSDDELDFPFEVDDDGFEPAPDPLGPLADADPAPEQDVHRKKTARAGLPSFPESKPNNPPAEERFPAPPEDEMGGATEMNLPGLDGPSSDPFGAIDAADPFGAPALTASGSFPPPPGASGSGAFPPPAAFPADPLGASGSFSGPPKPSASQFPTPAEGSPRPNAFAGDGPAPTGAFPPPPGLTGSGGFAPTGTGAFPPPVDFGPHAAPATAEELGDIPGLMDADSDDPFAGVDADNAASVGAYSAFHAGADDVGPASAPLEPPSPTGEAIAKLELGKAGLSPGGLTHHEPTAIARAYQPPGARKKTSVYLSDGGDGLGWWPTALGVAAGIVVAALFVPGVAEHVAPLLGTVPRPVMSSGDEPVVPGSLDEVYAESTYVRTYETAAGHQLLVVGGSAAAAAAVGKVDAVVAVLDEGRVVERRTAPVGVVLDEATLFDAQTESYLSNAMAAKVPRALSEDDREPFMVVFWAPPANAEQKTFRVAFVKSDAAARAEK